MLAYLDQQGEDLQNLLDSTHLPEEFLRDPSFWIKSSEMEEFLKASIELTKVGSQLLQRAGHAGPELRSWGVLDSVLRMMPRPSEIFNQPQRFLSYFISPEPPLENVINKDSGIQLDLPVSSEMFPLVTTYLRHAFESLPVYIGQPLGVCQWEDIHLKILWSQEQESIFSSDPGRHISPELLRSIVASLEKHQQELEAKNRELQEKNTQLLKTYEESMSRFAQQESQKMTSRLISDDQKSGSLGDLLIPDEGHSERQSLVSQNLPAFNGRQLDLGSGTSLEMLQTNFAKMADYMVRAQQLVTLIIGQDRMKPAIKEAMRRTDWEMIKINFPQIVNQSYEILKQSARRNHETSSTSNNRAGLNPPN